MKVLANPPVHLTYCLNVHPGETWEENFEAIKTFSLAVRDRVGPDRPFGLGLRLGRPAANRIAAPEMLSRFKAFLERHDLYVFTINGFPYGQFHHAPVKEDVYLPDWRTRERLEYTMQLAHILSNLLPEGVSGSISTVPGSYKTWVRAGSDKNLMIENMMACVARLADIREKTGRDLHIGLEPEPDCFLETTKEIVTFFTDDLAERGRRYLSESTGCTEEKAGEMIRRHLGVCFDTCHMSLQFEDLSESIALLNESGIRLSKIQLSAALRTIYTEGNLKRLDEFCDPVYLHQVKSRSRTGTMSSHRDLSEVLADRKTGAGPGDEWRVHFHLPLYFAGDGALQSTSSDLNPDFFRHLTAGAAEHLEIETYTFSVLPEYLKAGGVVDSIAEEYRWVLERLRA